MKIYLSGKVTGIPHPIALAKFQRAEQKLKKQLWGSIDKKFEILNPMTFCANKYGWPWEQYMELCLQKLKDCTHIYMLADWQESKGAKIEHEEAQKMNLVITYQPVYEKVSG